MPILGQGIIPSGNIGNELTYVTRRAFVPKLVVQQYNASPLLAALYANAQTASGGVSGVTVPVQGAQMVQFEWSDYSGSFSAPSVQAGVQNAEYDLKLGIIPIPFLGMEGAVQLDHDVIPLIEARMNDAGNVAADQFATALFNNTTNNQAFIGLAGAIDDGTEMATYGGLSRSTNTWWQSKRYSPSGTPAPTRALMLQYITGVLKSAGGELPSFGVTGLGTWAMLAQDYMGLERYDITPGRAFSDSSEGAKSAFRALEVAGVPIYADPYAPEGTIYFLNMNYLSLYIHKDFAMAFTGFQSTLPNLQLGYIGAVCTVAELVSVKPKSMGVVTGLDYLAI